MSINEYRTCCEGLKYVSKSKSRALSTIAELRLDDMRERVANHGSKQAKKLMSEIGTEMQIVTYNTDKSFDIIDYLTKFATNNLEYIAILYIMILAFEGVTLFYTFSVCFA